MPAAAAVYSGRIIRIPEARMPLVDPSHPLAGLLERDRRYPLDAYIFILEAL